MVERFNASTLQHLNGSAALQRHGLAASDVDAAVDRGQFDLRSARPKLAVEVLAEREVFLHLERELVVDASVEGVGGDNGIGVRREPDRDAAVDRLERDRFL